MTNNDLNEIWIEAETQGSVRRLNAQALIVEVRRLQAAQSELVSAVKAERAAEQAVGDDLDPPAKFMQLPEWYSLQDAKARTDAITDKLATNNIILPV